MLDTRKFEQWQFRMQQYLQHEHYALWEVIEFGDSYEAPKNNPSITTISTTTTSTTSGDKSRRTVTLTTEDMQKKKNDVKAITTLLLSLPDEYQLRFSKHKTTKELRAAILKTFGSNEATKKTKKNLLKQQYGNFRAEGSETLEQTFTRLQVIIGQLQFMGVEVEQDDLNQKFLTSLAPEWLMHTIAEVQKKSEPNTQNMAFISSTKHSRGNDEVNTASVCIASSNVPTASANVSTVSISQETACAYIASQSGGSQIKFKDINQINEDDIEEMDIKWNMLNASTVIKWAIFQENAELLETRRDTYRQGSKAKEQTPKALMAIDGVGWDWSYMANDEEDHALVVEAPTKFVLMANTSTENKVFNNFLCSKDCKKNNDSLNSKITDLIDKLFDAKNMIYHYKLALAQVESRLVEYKEREVKYIEKIRTLEFYDKGKMECIETLKKELETLKQEKKMVDGKLAGLLSASKDLDNLIESQRSDKSKEGLGYTAVPPPTAQLYLSPKKDLSWTSLLENSVLFTDSECIVLGRDFKLLDDANILLRTHRKHNMYSIDLKNIVPHKDLTCLVTKASADECYQWDRRLGHLNFKTMNKLVRHNLVRGLPTKCFENDQNCTACLKGKQHKASLYAAARHQVTPKTSNLLSVKRIFKYLTAYPKLDLWYPRDSPFDLEAFFDSDYANANGDRKSTTSGCQFLRRRLISWQCKKQIIVATSFYEDEYVAATSCCGQ
nr:putative ribonuclease H-like domain-containing protein [Tanacetum cinerariifolium]GEZ17218.1 putative ribonuclease H-like domain-containing protein [Tanacetum cinerariifolium]